MNERTPERLLGSWAATRLRSEAQAVSVTAPGAKAGVNATEINAELEEGGRITGKVTDASTGAVLEGVLVCAREGSGETPLGQCALTHSGGEYMISSLASGNYKVGFNVHEYVTQYYSGKSSLSEAQPVSVIAPNMTSGIDAALQRSGTPPVNTTPPVVSGTPAVGAALLCANGLWTGKPAPTFTRLWLRDGVPIPGALGSSYVVQGADAGHRISCLVIAKNVRGEKSALSASVAIPSPPPPPPPPTPMITSIGSKLVVSGKAIKVRLTCAAAACRGSVELTLQVVVKRHRGRKPSLAGRPSSLPRAPSRWRRAGALRLRCVSRRPAGSASLMPGAIPSWPGSRCRCREGGRPPSPCWSVEPGT